MIQSMVLPRRKPMNCCSMEWPEKPPRRCRKRRLLQQQRQQQRLWAPRCSAGSIVFCCVVAAFSMPSDVSAFVEFERRRSSAIPLDILRQHYEQRMVRQKQTSVLFVSTSAVPDEGIYPNPFQAGASGPANTATKKSKSSKVPYKASLSAIPQLQRELRDSIRQRQYDRSMEMVHVLFRILQETSHFLSPQERLQVSATLDASLQELVVTLLASKELGRVLQAVDVINLQLSATALHPQYKSIPRSLVIAAIAALASFGSSVDNIDESGRESSRRCPLDESYRMLQRLVTGTGVRTASTNANQSSRRPQTTGSVATTAAAATSAPYDLHEREFVQVLNAFCNAGDMTMAHRIVALQERTPHAPPLSAASYSILLKGYGRRRDLHNVQTVLQRAQANDIEPDVVMLNTLIDAYINCNAMDQAHQVFGDMKDGRSNFAPPNRRTYNIMLKGHAKKGQLPEAQTLSLEMKRLKLWDSVTTNTLVDAAVTAGDYSFAEDVLSRHGMRTNPSKTYAQHPNVQAYTELLDGYCKSGQLDRALAVLQSMQQRNVEPNEVTYTCLMSGFGRSGKVDLAHKTFEYMKTSDGIRPSAKLYNALISGLVSCASACTTSDSAGTTHAADVLSLDDRVDQAMKVLLRDMVKANVRPSCSTVSVLVDAMGRCRTPRMAQAKLLVEKLEQQGTIPIGNAKVVTALLGTLGKGGEIQPVLDMFQTIKVPDSVAVNAFMDSCCRCNHDKLAVQAFDLYYRKKSLKPDVISYSVLIRSCLKVSSVDARRRASSLYQEMKSRSIFPDNGLIDIALKAMIRDGTSHRLRKQDVHFILTLLKDAEALEWASEQLDRRKRAVRAVLTDRDDWRNDDALLASDSVLPLPISEDELFARKGWNKVDSGFRLWGGGPSSSVRPKATGPKTNTGPCTFLESHGWNDVESGFRLF